MATNNLGFMILRLFTRANRSLTKFGGLGGSSIQFPMNQFLTGSPQNGITNPFRKLLGVEGRTSSELTLAWNMKSFGGT